MGMFLKLFVGLLLCVAGIQAIPTVPVDRVSDAPAISRSVTDAVTNTPLAVEGDLAATLDYQNKSLSVYKRGANNFYTLVASRAYANAAPDPQTVAVTMKGGWIAMAASPQHEIWRVNASGALEPGSFKLSIANQYGWMVSEDTYAALLADGIYTYKFNGTQWTLARKEAPQNYTKAFATMQSITQLRAFLRPRSNYFALYYATPNTQPAQVWMYGLNSNQSWYTVAEFNMTSAYGVLMNFLWDGDQTIFIASPFLAGSSASGIAIIKKINADWQLAQFMTSEDLGISQNSYLGISTALVDANNFVASMPFDKQSYLGGTILWFQPNAAGEWNATRQISVSDPTGVLGLTVVPLDDSFVTFDCETSLTTLLLSCYLATPRVCVVAPTNVTCHDQVSSACTSFEFDLDQLYTINTPEGCGQVSASLSDLRGSTQGLEVDLLFRRDLAEDTTCTVTVTCDRPIAAVPQQPSLVSPAARSMSSNLLAELVLVFMATVVVLI